MHCKHAQLVECALPPAAQKEQNQKQSKQVFDLIGEALPLCEQRSCLMMPYLVVGELIRAWRADLHSGSSACPKNPPRLCLSILVMLFRASFLWDFVLAVPAGQELDKVMLPGIWYVTAVGTLQVVACAGNYYSIDNSLDKR